MQHPASITGLKLSQGRTCDSVTLKEANLPWHLGSMVQYLCDPELSTFLNLSKVYLDNRASHVPSYHAV